MMPYGNLKSPERVVNPAKSAGPQGIDSQRLTLPHSRMQCPRGRARADRSCVLPHELWRADPWRTVKRLAGDPQTAEQFTRAKDRSTVDDKGCSIGKRLCA